MQGALCLLSPVGLDREKLMKGQLDQHEEATP